MDFKITGIGDVEKAFDRIIAKASATSREIVRESAILVESATKGNFEGSHAKGEPHVGGDKPNVVTGTLRRSIRHDPIAPDGLTGAFTLVGPSVVYARRVELGFTGTDSKGRRYSQPPHAYFAPGVRDKQDEMHEIARDRWSRAVSGF